MAEVKLYHKKTDGGAEYLCTQHIAGHEEVGDIKSAVVRLDGGPVLLVPDGGTMVMLSMPELEHITYLINKDTERLSDHPKSEPIQAAKKYNTALLNTLWEFHENHNEQ